jgi:Ca2+-transporting ATPase
MFACELSADVFTSTSKNHSVNVSAILITFISAVSSSDESSVLTAVQLLCEKTLSTPALSSNDPDR